MNADPIRIELWNPDQSDLAAEIAMLGGVLRACVHAGASVSFVLPFAMGDAEGFWRDQVLPPVRAGTRRVLIARRGDRIIATAQLDLATPPNQPHRAEVKKLLVHPEARRAGVARSLMTALEEQARSDGRTLLTLDTVTGGAAESLYLSAGYTRAGVIPRYALNFDSTKLESTTVLYKDLSPR